MHPALWVIAITAALIVLAFFKAAVSVAAQRVREQARCKDCPLCSGGERLGLADDND